MNRKTADVILLMGALDQKTLTHDLFWSSRLEELLLF